MPRPRVVFAILDAFPHAHVSRELTPVLAGLAEEGGWARDGVRGVLTASTYPNHATFVTGAEPQSHGIVTSNAVVDGALCPAKDVGPAARTLFEDCYDAGLRAVGVFGDQNLVHICGATRADSHWPPDGELPEGTARGRLNYGADRAVVEAVDGLALAEADLVVLQLDETDTERHLEGPNSEGALAQCRATDAAFGEILERLRTGWHETVVIAVSDHDCEDVTPGAVDLCAEAHQRGLGVHIEHDGTACFVLGKVEREALLALPSVVEAERVAPGQWVVWGAPGQQYGIDFGLRGQHGSPRSRTQVGIVGGGHPEVARIASWLGGPQRESTGWASQVKGLLGL